MPNVRRPSIEVTPPPNSKQTARFELDTLAPLYPNNHPLSQRARVLSESMQPRPTLISPSTPTGKSLPQVLSLEILKKTYVEQNFHFYISPGQKTREIKKKFFLYILHYFFQKLENIRDIDFTSFFVA